MFVGALLWEETAIALGVIAGVVGELMVWRRAMAGDGEIRELRAEHGREIQELREQAGRAAERHAEELGRLAADVGELRGDVAALRVLTAQALDAERVETAVRLDRLERAEPDGEAEAGE